MHRLIAGLFVWSLGVAAAAFVPAADAAEPDLEKLVFVTGRDTGRIAVVDARTDTVVRSMTAPGVPRRSLFAARRARLVVAIRKAHGVHVFDVAAGRLLSIVDVGFEVKAMKIASDGETVAAAGVRNVAIISIDRMAILKTLLIPAAPGAMIFGRDGKYLLVGDATRARVHAVRLGAAGEPQVIDLGPPGTGGLVHLARTPGGGTGMAIHGSGEATILDLKAMDIAGRLALPGRQEKIFPTVNSQYFLLPNFGTGTLSIISTWTYGESGCLALKRDVTALNTLLADSFLFAFNRDSVRVEIFDLDRRRRIRELVLPGKPISTMTGPDGLKIYTALGDRDAVAVIDVRTLGVTKVIEHIGFAPASIFTDGRLSYCH